MKQLRYTGGFNSITNVPWRVEIWQDSETIVTPQEIAFGVNPIEIEWAETDKLEPVQSSSATLTLFCESDRKFIDLYTVIPGSIRLDVYRNNDHYWSGTLDPELYEEPYSYKENYEVTLTFSDFAILDRKKWSQTGFITLKEIIEKSLQESQIKRGDIVRYISTKTFDYTNEELTESVSILNDNFYDEDGEAMTVREVLDESLRPFALRMIQKNGEIIIYDLNALKTAIKPIFINWESDNATLGVDKTYNNVKVTFSPYEKTDLVKNEVIRSSVINPQKAINIMVPGEASPGFTIEIGENGQGVKKANGTKYFKITASQSGSDSTGVAYTLRQHGINDNANLIFPATREIGGTVMESDIHPFIKGIPSYERSDLKLKLMINFLFDVRYNPFEPPSLGNEEGNFDDMEDWCNFAYIPFLLTQRDNEGRAISHWENKMVKDSDGPDQNSYNCRWLAGEGKWGDAWFCFYDQNRENNTGLGDWKRNKPIIGYYQDNLPQNVTKKGDGELIDLPTTSGWLELKIGSGVVVWDYKRKEKDIHSHVHWILYKEPSITVVDKWGKDLKTQDIEHNAWINKEAKENLEIETIIGTMKKKSPIALGQIFRTNNKYGLSTFFRAGKTDLLERLLIGTVYSNYAGRNITLSGTVTLLPQFGIYTDHSTPGDYLILGELQNLITDESEIKMVEFHVDNFEAIEYN